MTDPVDEIPPLPDIDIGVVGVEEFEDDGGPQFVLKCADGSALWLRVGPVFYGTEQAPEPVVWIEYQDTHMASPLEDLTYISKAAWNQLDQAVRGYFEFLENPSEFEEDPE